MRVGIGRTDIGVVRNNNEDSILVCNEKIGLLPNVYVVADGMGGHSAGDIASRCAIESFAAYLKENANVFKYNQDLLNEATACANGFVFRLSLESEDRNGMGTTFSACSVDDDNIYFAHIGDSRIYLVTKENITQITTDHSYVNELVRTGEITKEEAKNHPKKNMLIRALGTESCVPADIGYIPTNSDETFLICSDGLTNMLSDEDIFKIVNSEQSIEKKVDRLTEAAISNGGIDNISVILIQYE